MPREIYRGKEEIADLGCGVRPVAIKRGFDLVCLLADFAQDRARIVPVEADSAGFGLQLERAGEGRERDRHTGKRALARGGSARGLLLRLDPLPQSLDGLRRLRALVAEDMWMPADELFGDRFDHTAEIERT